MKLTAIFLTGVVISPIVWGFGKIIVFLTGLAAVGYIIKTAIDLLEEEANKC